MLVGVTMGWQGCGVENGVGVGRDHGTRGATWSGEFGDGTGSSLNVLGED